jgi:hypothetical protein
MDRGKCRSCDAPVLWVQSATTGSPMPLDAEPVEGGNVAIKDGVAHVMRGELFEEMIDGPRYQSHFISCPNAARHRKSREPQRKGKEK